MVYHNQLIAVIKANGKILRELPNNNTVRLPFNTEYSIIFKNLNSKDALIKVSIDGENVLDNSEIIVRANSSGSLEGFLKNNTVTNKFKFIQKTDQIVNHRGDRIDDGVVRIEYRYARIKPATIQITNWVYNSGSVFHPPGCQCSFCNPHYQPKEIFPFLRPSSSSVYVSSSINPAVTNCSSDPIAASNSVAINDSNFNNIRQDEGITVKGSESGQRFENSFIDEVEEQSHVIIFCLKGYKDEEANTLVRKPEAVKRKVSCPTCGTRNKYRNKFCLTCGTALF
jgi:hypothetical protein